MDPALRKARAAQCRAGRLHPAVSLYRLAGLVKEEADRARASSAVTRRVVGLLWMDNDGLPTGKHDAAGGNSDKRRPSGANEDVGLRRKRRGATRPAARSPR